MQYAYQINTGLTSLTGPLNSMNHAYLQSN